MAVRYPAAFSMRGYRSQDAPNVLEIPSAYSAPTRGDVVRRMDPSSGNCDCSGRRQGPNDYPSSGPQNPYAMPGPQPLGQPQAPQKPFQPPQNDPCAMNNEVLKGLGIDPQALTKCKGGARAPRRSPMKGSTRKYPYEAFGPRGRQSRRTANGQPAEMRVSSIRRRKTKAPLTQRQLFPRATSSKRKPPKGLGPAGSMGYRFTQNGACYDIAARRFVKRVKCG